MKITKKSRLLTALENKFGNTNFRYTDMVKEMLIINGYINNVSEYRPADHRGYYATNLTAYSSEYLYSPSVNDPRHLTVVYTESGSKRYCIDRTDK